MALNGFEGFEKRLELRFAANLPARKMGLRLLNFRSLVQILEAVQCCIVSAVGNLFCDSYVLSESSLFVFPTKIIIKTCGTTQLLNSIRPLIHQAYHQLNLSCSSCRYTRGAFIFPMAQLFPHTSFNEEVRFIESSLPKSLSRKKASVMSQSWHVFVASIDDNTLFSDDAGCFTIEVCMTGLDPVKARKFFLPYESVYSGDGAGREMTSIAGIQNINPKEIICDYGFDPCGYSMNGIDGRHYSTIHVTPEGGYSYASFECSGAVGGNQVEATLQKAIHVFRPKCVSIATTSAPCMAHEMTEIVSKAAAMIGLQPRGHSFEKFPADCGVVFQTFSGHH